MTEPIRILIVEDQPADAELAEREIRKSARSFMFERAETREDFLAALDSFHPDLIISDYRMPQFDGLTALKIILQKSPFMPVIILTGALNEDTAVECMKAGAADYVIKEHIKRLGQAVIHALSEKQARLEQNQAEKQLLFNEKRYRHLVESSNDWVWEVDRNGIYTYAGPQCRELFGYEPEEILGKKLFDLMPSEEGNRFSAIYAILSRQRRAFRRLENTRLRKDGMPVYLESNGAPILDESDNFLGYRGMDRDISERKMAELEQIRLQEQLLQAQKMESIGRLAGGVAHDFNNMLSVILGYSELIRSQLHKDDPMISDIEQIEHAGRRAKDITQQLLAFSRKQILEPILMNLNEIISATQKGLSRLMGEDIVLEFLPGADLHAVKFDRSQLDQILINLAANARDAMPQGGKLLIETANVHLEEEKLGKYPGFSQGDYVLLTISDTGMGMDRETLNHIFEPFFTTKSVGKGTGLGLATVYGIVSQGGGFIEAFSEPGLGCTFKIYFPKVQPDTSISKEPGNSQVAKGNGKVLVVEDDPMVRNMTVAMLKTVGYSVVAYGSPQQALEHCQKDSTPIDLLITDVVMPELSGADLRDRILQIRPDTKVLFISGYVGEIIAHHGVLDDGVNFVRKPFSMKELSIAVQTVMKR